MSIRYSSTDLFLKFLSYFPVIDPPLTLSQDSIKEISRINKAFPQLLINEILIPLEASPIDEFTEFIPCFKFPDEKDYIALIYWKGQLQNYEYYLATFDKRGKLISKKSIAGTRFNDEYITTSVASIDEDKIIHVIVGGKDIKEPVYDPENSQSMSLELLPTGDIIFSLQT